MTHAPSQVFHNYDRKKESMKNWTAERRPTAPAQSEGAELPGSHRGTPKSYSCCGSLRTTSDLSLRTTSDRGTWEADVSLPAEAEGA